MRTRSSKIVVAGLLLLTAASLVGQRGAAASNAQLNALIAQQWEYELNRYPERATEIGDNRYNDRLGDYSPAAFARELEHLNKALVEFQAFDPNGLGKEDQLNRMLMIRTLQMDVDDAR